MIPRWYRVLIIIWALIVVPFWWFAAAFNGESFFSFPELSGPREGDGWQITFVFQLVVIAAFILPPLIAPFAFLAAKRSKKTER